MSDKTAAKFKSFKKTFFSSKSTEASPREPQTNLHKSTDNFLSKGDLWALEFSVIFKIFILLSVMFGSIAVFFLLMSFIIPALTCLVISASYLCGLLLIRRGELNFSIALLHFNGFLYSGVNCYYFGFDYGFEFFCLHSIAFCYVGVFAKIWHAAIFCAFTFGGYCALYFLSFSDYCLAQRLIVRGYDLGFVLYMFHAISIALMFFSVVLSMREKLYASVIDKSLSHIKAPDAAVNEAMSGLLSRLEFCEYIESADSVFKANFALVDIDRFKKINDFYGYAYGDLVIATAAEKLLCTLENCIIVRWGGEEFLIFDQDGDADIFFSNCYSFSKQFEQITYEPGFSASCSIGCLCVRSEFRPYALDEYLAKLEKNLADAKSSGQTNIITSNF